MLEQHKKSFILNLAFIASILLCAYFTLKYLVSWLFPFLIGLLVASLLQPAINAIVAKTLFKKRGAAIFVTVLFYLAVFSVLWLLILYLAGEASALAARVPRLLTDVISPMLQDLNQQFANVLRNISPELSENFSSTARDISQMLQSAAVSLSSATLSGVAGIAKKLPIIFLTFIFSIVSSVMISLDYSTVTGFIKRQLPQRLVNVIHNGKGMITGSFLKLIRAYIIIMFITFSELCLAFFILKVENFVAIALVVAILDILPVLGTGTVLIPWALFSVLSGNFLMAGGMILTYLVITVVRNAIEPKIVGSQIGLHPIVTITAMYLGLRIFGMPGLFGAPITAVIIKHINDEGYFKIYK